MLTLQMQIEDEKPVFVIPVEYIDFHDETKTKRADAPHAFRLDIDDSDTVTGTAIEETEKLAHKVVINPKTEEDKRAWTDAIVRAVEAVHGKSVSGWLDLEVTEKGAKTPSVRRPSLFIALNS